MRRRSLPPVAPFRRAGDILAAAAQLLRPKEHLTVSQWAQKHMGYDPEVLPWQMEIMDALGAGGDVDLMGPAQIGKSQIGLAWWGWSVEHSPADFLICQPDRDMMRDFVVRRIDPMVQSSPVLRQALLEEPGADNLFLKQFRGMISTHIWPVASQFRARPVPRGWLDDFDQIPEDIEGQGSAHALMQGRQTWFEGRAGTFCSSSPAAGTSMVTEGGGIEGRVNGGTAERLAPACPECGERFVVDMEKHLRFDRNGSPEEAQASAHVVCASNGCVLLPAARLKLLASCAQLPERGFVPTNATASRRTFAIDGLMGVTGWGTLARAWREAEIAWQERQDETPLRAFWNTKAGRNYRSKLLGEKQMDADDLVKRIEPDWLMGTVPPGVKVLVASVDVQSNRFEVLVCGFGEGLETWLVDRFDIRASADGLSLVDPATRLEDWAMLTTEVLQRRYPMAAAPDVTMPVLTVAVDMHGEKGVSPNAAAWWRSAVALGIKKDRLTLVRGGPASQRWAVQGSWVDVKKAGAGANRNGVRIWNVNTSMLKSTWDARLRRTVPGAGYVHLPSGFEYRWLEEMTAEVYERGRWVKKRARNETLDLMVYAQAAIMRPPYAQTRADMAWVPLEYKAPEVSAAVATPAKVSNDLVQKPEMQKPAKAQRVNKFTNRQAGSFIRRRS